MPAPISSSRRRNGNSIAEDAVMKAPLHSVPQADVAFFQRTLLHVGLLVALGLLIYLPRLTERPYWPEESLRVLIAEEMVISDDVLVPSYWGQKNFFRPPLQQWIVMGTAWFTGNFDHLTGRLPSALAVIATALLIYFYCRTQHSATLAFLAGLFFLVTFHVFKYGTVANMDTLFTFLLAGALFSWHAAETRRWSATAQWTLAYSFLALAVFTKGFNQAPLFFGVSIGCYLLLQRRLGTLFQWGHLVGILWFVVLLAPWNLYILHRFGWKTLRHLHFHDVTDRFLETGFVRHLEHWILFPFEQYAVALPPALFLLLFFVPGFRRSIRPFPRSVTFCLVMILSTFFFIWYPPDGKTRYYLPMLPAVAVLGAFVVEQCRRRLKRRAEKRPWWAFLWPWYVKICLVGIPLIGLTQFLIALAGHHGYYHTPLRWGPSLLFFVLSLPIAAILVATSRRNSAKYVEMTAVALVSLAGLWYNLTFLDVIGENFNDFRTPFTELLKKIPTDAEIYAVNSLRDRNNLPYYYTLETGRILPRVLLSQTLPSDRYFFIDERDLSAWKQKNVEIIDKIYNNRNKPKYSKEKPIHILLGKVVADTP